MKWNVGTKILAGFGLALAIFVIVGIVSWRNVQKQTEDAEWVTHTHEVLATLSQLLAALQDAEAGQRGYVITADDDYVALHEAGITAAQTQFRHLQTLVADNPTQTSRAESLSPLIAERIAALREGLEARRKQDFAAAQAIIVTGRGKRAMDNLRQTIATMTTEEQRLLKQRSEVSVAASDLSNRTLAWGTVLALLIAGFAGIAITRNVAGPMRELTSAADRITVGDLGTDIVVGDRQDEVGQLAVAFARMTRSLRAIAGTAEQIAGGDLRVTFAPASAQDALGQALVRMIANLRSQITSMIEGATVLGSAATEIVASTSQLASGASESAAAVSQTTTTVEEIRQTAQMASQKSRAVAENAQRTVQITNNGRKSTEDVGAAMARIRGQMDAIGDSMMRLSEQTQAIGQIIASVEDLAAQSNLLAVNAAIEAAKAGDQGKGFGVVAQEVKSLAEQSRQATERVRSILVDIQKATTAAVMATEQGNKAVEAGARQSEVAGESIAALAGSVSEAAQAATQIAASSQQQLIGMDQVASAMENIKQASTQNVASARQLENAARGLGDLGMRLKSVVENYKV